MLFIFFHSYRRYRGWGFFLPQFTFQILTIQEADHDHRLFCRRPSLRVTIRAQVWLHLQILLDDMIHQPVTKESGNARYGVTKDIRVVGVQL
jgi:hypothetical protein